ncbi:hypothetical protein JX265_006585 [Neoarthrinium moseri]|uniref:Uncharacterized protein n=1 Tax=Neoarthrinium moseri TaxID=1658444 RepID=A0A9Q0APD8_9PEZI|nr:uncharacterized protein JN550_003043 [Neoarthrinium moseri]KAI1855272.1 hypothetical protein JX266_000137 [Neoarthrinium moseri]KAI1869495.1 hypothetical protein JX265_006585 [Neoarthrinium moseri]KAI1873774.1 hypothetical protein JN550_003043 [Neoarthrinium moseri]
MKFLLFATVLTSAAAGQFVLPNVTYPPAGAQSCRWAMKPGNHLQDQNCYELRFNRNDGTENAYQYIQVTYPNPIDGYACELATYDGSNCTGSSLQVINKTKCANVSAARSYKVVC